MTYLLVVVYGTTTVSTSGVEFAEGGAEGWTAPYACGLSLERLEPLLHASGARQVSRAHLVFTDYIRTRRC